LIKFEKKAEGGTPNTTVTLPRDQREKSRLKVTLDDGREAGLFFEKGTSFQDGDLIISYDESVLVEIKAADETVSSVLCDDPLQLARACYHLGNRHIPLQINEGILRYQHDHVLDNMVRGLGLEVKTEQAPFEPEAGAYSVGSHDGGEHHHHSHNHDDDHHHGHSH